MNELQHSAAMFEPVGPENLIYDMIERYGSVNDMLSASKEF